MCLRRGDLCHESIAVPRHSLDVLLRMKSFSQLRNTIVEIVVFDDGVWPYRVHECVFAHEFPGILDQHAESVEEFAAQADFFVIAKQPSLVHVEEVVAKEVLGHYQICETALA